MWKIVAIIVFLIAPDFNNKSTTTFVLGDKTFVTELECAQHMSKRGKWLGLTKLQPAGKRIKNQGHFATSVTMACSEIK